MSAPIPCPNPNCGQLLAVASIQGTGKVACPRCGTVLQFRSGTAPPPVPPPPPTASPNIPIAQPVRPAPPPVPGGPPGITPTRPPPIPGVAGHSAPLSADDDAEDEDDDEPEYDPHLSFDKPAEADGEPRPRREKGSMVWFFIVAPIAMIFFSTTLFLIWLALRYVWANPDQFNADAYVKMENAYFEVLRDPWGRYQVDAERAKKARVQMVVNYVACRSEPNDAVALFYRDYQNRMPGEGEVIDVALKKLRGDPNSRAGGYFSGLEWERKEGENTWAGKPAIRLEFQGIDGENVECSGEAWILAYNGIGYWFFTWGPKPIRDELQPEWEELRQRFSIGTKRQYWKESILDPVLVRVPETPYELQYPGGEQWELRQEVGWDPAARIVLLGYERDNPDRINGPIKKYAGKMAVLQILRLAPAESLPAALEAAKAHLLEQQKAENPDTRMEVILDRENKPREGTAKIGTADGITTRLEVIPQAGARKRFFRLAVLTDAQGVLVIQFGCPFDRREYWESEVTSIFKTVRVFKAPGS